MVNFMQECPFVSMVMTNSSVADLPNSFSQLKMFMIMNAGVPLGGLVLSRKLLYAIDSSHCGAVTARKIFCFYCLVKPSPPNLDSSGMSAIRISCILTVRCEVIG